MHRVSDTTPIHLGHHARADGRWRIYVFADESRPGSGAAHQFAGWLADDPASPVRAHTPQHLDLDAWFDVKIVYQQQFGEIDLRRVPAVFKPDRGRFRITDWEKVHATGEEHDIFTERRISRDGALVVVRPDQYVANVLPLTAHDELSAFFAGIFA